jgi:hypothetical protein
MSADPPSFPSKVEAALKDLRLKLEMELAGYIETKNPVYVWQAIKLCTDHKLPLPDWVSAYLASVANRMLCDEVRQSPDLRAVLSYVLGFKFVKKSPGPGRLLDPNAAPEDRMTFTIIFLGKLAENHECEPSEALREACNKMDPSFADDKEDNTLWGYLTEELGLAERPKTNEEWRAAGDARFFPFYVLIEEWYRDHARPQDKVRGAG